MKEKRILLKLSGEALAGDKKTGFDESTVLEIAAQVKKIHDLGAQVGVVIGGGNFWRGRSSENMDRTKADQIGMLATVMNCIYVSEMFRSTGMKTAILTPFMCGSVTELFSKDLANRYFEDGTVVTPDLLLETGIIKKLNDGVKVLGRGELTKKLTVKADKFTEGAVSKIEAAGGKTEVI